MEFIKTLHKTDATCQIVESGDQRLDEAAKTGIGHTLYFLTLFHSLQFKKVKSIHCDQPWRGVFGGVGDQPCMNIFIDYL